MAPKCALMVRLMQKERLKSPQKSLIANYRKPGLLGYFGHFATYTVCLLLPPQLSHDRLEVLVADRTCVVGDHLELVFNRHLDRTKATFRINPGRVDRLAESWVVPDLILKLRRPPIRLYLRITFDRHGHGDVATEAAREHRGRAAVVGGAHERELLEQSTREHARF